MRLSCECEHLTSLVSPNLSVLPQVILITNQYDAGLARVVIVLDRESCYSGVSARTYTFVISLLTTLAVR